MVAANLPPQGGRPGLHCHETTLVCLLDETLSPEQQSIAEEHLSECVSCQERLETLVGDKMLWRETRSVYAEGETTEDHSGFVLNGTSEVQQDEGTVAWLRGIAAPPAEQDLSSLGRIDRYRMDSVIGSGGMGVVVAGHDPQLGRSVAIKFLAPHLAGVAPARRRFAREARAAAAIVHPAIMPIYGVNEKSYPPYLVMPLVGSSAGVRSLQDRMDIEGPLDLETSIGIAAQIAEGLAAAHDRGVVHRDIKPGNILCEENSPRVLISDFGLARAIDDATVTISGMVAGTPQYMSPEQAAGEDVGPQSDLFSLGSVIYAMLTGRPPFVADSPIAVLRKVIDTPVKSASGRVESLPPWVDLLLDRFFAKDPAQRIATAGATAELLRNVEGHVRNPSANELPAELKQPRQKTKPVAFAAVVVLMIGVAAWQLPKFGTAAPSDANAVAADSKQANSRVTMQGSLQESFVQQSVVVDNVPPVFREPVSGADLSWHWDDFQLEVNLIEQELDFMENEH